MGHFGDFQQPYLPIEWLRCHDLPRFVTNNACQTFLSSGTTGAQRSRAPFSRRGLDLYRRGALLCFRQIVKEKLGCEIPETAGFSLIPTRDIWPDSSLAQMVHWLSEHAPVQYVTAASYESALGNHAKGPVWIFATALHFLQLMEENVSVDLPPGALLIETGGYKGRTLSLTKHDFYQALSRHFNIPTDRIVSEYGMCELASQAYDWTSEAKSTGRRLRFPGWVQPFVLPGTGKFLTKGTGALTVWDPLRIDLPWPIRTQDVVSLHADGSFELLGRASTAVTRGCSYNVDMNSKPTLKSSRTGTAAPDRRPRPEPARHSFLPAWQTFLKSPRVQQAFACEIGDPTVAKRALTDLAQSFPQDPKHLSAALDTAVGAGPYFHEWLMLLPNNHSLAGIYPLVFGALAGLKTHVRIPTEFAGSPNLLLLTIDFLNEQFDGYAQQVPSTMRLPDVPPAADAVFAFGHPKTIKEISRLTSLPVHAFDQDGALSFVEARSLAHYAPEIIHDAFGLAGRGCMSTRAVVIWNGRKEDAEAYQQILLEYWRVYWQSPLDPRVLAGLDQLSLGLDMQRYRPLTRQKLNDALFPVAKVPVLSQDQFCLPIFICEEPSFSGAAHRLKQILPRISIAYSEESTANFHLPLHPHGSSSSYAWDGTLWETPLFAPAKRS